MKRCGALVLATCLVACERCDTPPRSLADLQAPALAGSALTADADGRPPLELTVSEALLTRTGAGGQVLVTVAPRTRGYFTSARLELGLNSTARGEISPILDGARCAVRYLEQGALSEADYAVWRASGELGGVDDAGATRVALRITCRKRFAKTVTGAPHAPGLPEEIRLSGAVMAQPPVVR